MPEENAIHIIVKGMMMVVDGWMDGWLNMKNLLIREYV